MIDLTDDWFNRRNSINDVLLEVRYVAETRENSFYGMFFVELLIVIV